MNACRVCEAELPCPACGLGMTSFGTPGCAGGVCAEKERVRAEEAERTALAAAEGEALYKTRYQEKSAESQQWAARAGAETRRASEALAALRENAEDALHILDSTDPLIYEKDWGSDQPSDAFRTLVHYLTRIRSRALAAEVAPGAVSLAALLREAMMFAACKPGCSYLYGGTCNCGFVALIAHIDSALGEAAGAERGGAS
jgi:hypothetical protein